jgi:hypothetical protein
MGTFRDILISTRINGAVGSVQVPWHCDEEMRNVPIPLTDDMLTKHSVSLVYRCKVRLTEAVRVVIDFVVEVMRENADRIRRTRQR